MGCFTKKPVFKGVRAAKGRSAYITHPPSLISDTILLHMFNAYDASPQDNTSFDETKLVF